MLSQDSEARARAMLDESPGVGPHHVYWQRGMELSALLHKLVAGTDGGLWNTLTSSVFASGIRRGVCSARAPPVFR